VDQAGYRTKDGKAGYLTAASDGFAVLNAMTRDTVFRGVPTLAIDTDPSTGMRIWKADFSSFQLPGTYMLRTSAGDTSQLFMIADTVFDPVYRVSLRGFYYQRCGLLLAPEFAGAWSRPACHTTTDAYFHASAESTGFAAVAGGWHDAGDYGKYVVNAGISVGTLLAAYDWFPSKFSSDRLNIPESGNGVPDVLDEARYELAWLMTMQAVNGGLFFKVTKPQFEGFVMPDNDPGDRYIYQLSSTATGDFAAVMARAARSFREFDTSFAGLCMAAGLRAWQYLLNHPSIVPPGGFHNPTGTVTGEYGDGDDSDERLWAASEVYLATGDSAAHSYFLANYSQNGIVTGTMSWGDVRSLAECTYLRGSRSGINAGVQTLVRQSLISYAGTLLSLHDASGFRDALRTSEYYWGSNSVVLNNAILLILAAEEGAGQKMRDAALDQLHYILGVNGHGMSFVTGIGGRHPLHPHHRPSASDGITEPVPGLLAGGPNHNITNDPVLQAHFSSATPPALCYIDDQGSYASNEICINWNAPLVFVAGYFSGASGSTGLRPQGWLDAPRIELEQNYPNPFNPRTVVSFQLPVVSNVELAIYDVLGRTAAVLMNERKPPGLYTVTFDASGLASGMYLYRLHAGTFNQTRRMMFLK
jgi:endoglucanase